MFKGHPKGLYVAFFANMGERFGFYTMMSCLVFFLQSSYGLEATRTGNIYSNFYFAIYGLALVGGIIADKTQNYKGVIFLGIITMLAGYVIMATPNLSLTITMVGLYVIALGNGLFKGNLQALVGQLYDDPKYEKLRDSAFSVFYMGINVGALAAPFAANGIRNWYLRSKGYVYDADLPSLCHRFIDGSLTDNTTLQELANNVTGTQVADLSTFTSNYLDVFSTGYNYAFGIAGISMIISLVVYAFFKSQLPDRKKQAAEDKASIEMPKAEVKKRLIALGLVFLVVIFFWMSFHQNGLTLSFFARDYTDKTVEPFTNLFFDFKSILAIFSLIVGSILLFGKDSKKLVKGIGGILILTGGCFIYYFYTGYPGVNPIQPEIFQAFNPIFIVFLTPVVLALFAFLRKRNIEPSTPRKIGIGMILASLGFVVMIVGSMSLMSPSILGGEPAPDRVSPYWLINTYLILTISELFLSPMGISFVSKVSPPKLQGLMQGGWLLATALGNKLLFVGSLMWDKIELWQLWLIFVVCCLASAAFIFSIMKRLESSTKGA